MQNSTQANGCIWPPHNCWVVKLFYFINCQSTLTIQESFGTKHLPLLTQADGCSWPARNCCDAKLSPELSSCNARTSSTNCSARRQPSVCWRPHVLSVSAANGVALACASSITQSDKASTKFNLASVSLCSLCNESWQAKCFKLKWTL